MSAEDFQYAPFFLNEVGTFFKMKCRFSNEDKCFRWNFELLLCSIGFTWRFLTILNLEMNKLKKKKSTSQHRIARPHKKNDREYCLIDSYHSTWNISRFRNNNEHLIHLKRERARERERENEI